MKRKMLWSVICLSLAAGLAVPAAAQEEAPEAPPAVEAPAAPAGEAAPALAGEGLQEETNEGSGSFWAVVRKSGALGIFLWVVLFATAAVAVYVAVDCVITIRARRIVPENLVENVNRSMAEGDVIKALRDCENEPGPLANILTAGFSHVEEGFEVIQEAVSTAADLETEKIMQKLTWLSVVGNIAPMLGLLGTVQGMIMAFANLAGGAPDVGILAMNISQALYTTAAGLTIAVPCVAIYYTFRNAANKIVLRMEAMTIELIKDLRNVEVVEE